jgi:novobiocin biosynthesis protein NovU/D-mycarose 3-C-methyltransferase
MTPAELVDRYGLTSGDLVVEVGSGDGTRLRAVRGRGPRVLGVEPDVRLVARAFAAGVDTIAANFCSGVAGFIRRRYGAARLLLVTDPRAWGDPAASTAAAVRCLTPDGLIVAEVGPVESSARRAA